MACTVSVCFLLIHVFLLWLFLRYEVTPMAWINVFSIVFYVVSIVLALKGHLTYYPVLVYAEVVLHMSFAVFFTGWSSGFQVTLIGMNILLFYSQYISRRLSFGNMKALPPSIFGMAAYLILCVIDHYHTAPYPLPANVSFLFQIFWGITVFVIGIYYLNTFVNLALRSEEILSQVADHDQLTGLPNRYYMVDYMNQINDRTGMRGYWMAILDIDDFKKINDSLGHNCGDFVLQQIALILKDQDGDLQACRWGGEEFLIIGKEPEVNNGQGGIETMNRLCRKIENRKFFYNNQFLHITVTIGLAGYHDGMNMREWIEIADNNLYQGKKSGKNKVVA